MREHPWRKRKPWQSSRRASDRCDPGVTACACARRFGVLPLAPRSGQIVCAEAALKLPAPTLTKAVVTDRGIAIKQSLPSRNMDLNASKLSFANAGRTCYKSLFEKLFRSYEFLISETRHLRRAQCFCGLSPGGFTLNFLMLSLLRSKRGNRSKHGFLGTTPLRRWQRVWPRFENLTSNGGSHH